MRSYRLDPFFFFFFFLFFFLLLLFFSWFFFFFLSVSFGVFCFIFFFFSVFVFFFCWGVWVLFFFWTRLRCWPEACWSCQRSLHWGPLRPRTKFWARYRELLVGQSRAGNPQVIQWPVREKTGLFALEDNSSYAPVPVPGCRNKLERRGFFRFGISTLWHPVRCRLGLRGPLRETDAVDEIFGGSGVWICSSRSPSSVSCQFQFFMARYLLRGHCRTH